MREIFVVTHPQATHHLDGTVGGWFDSALTDLGLHQASLIAEQMAHVNGPSVELLSSDLLRTRQTADAIAQRLGKETRFHSGLREKSYGEAGGKPGSWLRERFIVPPRKGERLHHDEGIEGAETKWEWVQRIYTEMDEITSGGSNQKIIVTHGGTAQIVIAHWIGMPIESLTHVGFHLDSGSITHLVEDDYFHNRSVRKLNEISHLLGTQTIVLGVP